MDDITKIQILEAENAQLKQLLSQRREASAKEKGSTSGVKAPPSRSPKRIKSDGSSKLEKAIIKALKDRKVQYSNGNLKLGNKTLISGSDLKKNSKIQQRKGGSNRV